MAPFQPAPRASLRESLDTEHYSKRIFIAEVARNLPQDTYLLDAGAGKCQYRDYFAHTRYESCDFVQNEAESHTFLCDVQEIPRPDDTYDAILCTQVLDDLPHPDKAVAEMFRILKPGGSLYVTAPQGWGIHNEPYHFFNFTYYGLELLFNSAGFDIDFIKSRGGIFWYLAKRLRSVHPYMKRQWRQQLKRPWSTAMPDDRPASDALWLPLYWLFHPLIHYLLPLILFRADQLDRRQDYTLGYACHAIKPRAGD